MASWSNMETVSQRNNEEEEDEKKQHIHNIRGKTNGFKIKWTSTTTIELLEEQKTATKMHRNWLPKRMENMYRSI